jgi:hypothetical protein
MVLAFLQVCTRRLLEVSHSSCPGSLCLCGNQLAFDERPLGFKQADEIDATQTVPLFGHAPRFCHGRQDLLSKSVKLCVRAFGASVGIEQVGMQSPFIDCDGHFRKRALGLRPSDRAAAKVENREVKREADDDIGAGQRGVELVESELRAHHRRAKAPLVPNAKISRIHLSPVAT